MCDSDRRCVVFTANRGYALKSSREGLIRHFLSSGWRVVIATADDAESAYLVKLGANLELVDFKRGGLSLCSDFNAIHRLRTVFRIWQPALIHNFHAKPVIMASATARRILGADTAIINTITGLGHAFVGGGLSAGIAGFGYRCALPHANATIFQNQDDLDMFVNNRWLPEAKAKMIAGSGVDIGNFKFIDRKERSDSYPVVVMLGRLVADKGIEDFIEIASRIQRRWPYARFLLAGEEDTGHPYSVSADWVRRQRHIEYLGRLDDVFPLLKEADIFLFPSTYREGVPRVVMEAAATGLPTIAYDVPGVREAVRHNLTGMLVEKGDINELERSVCDLLNNRAKRLSMGISARSMAEEIFDINAIQEKYIDIYREVGIEI